MGDPPTAIDRLMSRVDVLKAQNAQQAAEIERLRRFHKTISTLYELHRMAGIEPCKMEEALAKALAKKGE